MIKKILTLILITVCFSISSYSLSDLSIMRHNEKITEDNRPQSKIAEEVRGIYITGNTVHWKPRFEELLQFVKDSDINSMVIDFKDDSGVISMKTDNEYILEVDPRYHRGSDYAGIIKMLNDNNIYTIARIVVFKDPHLSQKRPEWSIKTADGSLWRDRKGITWVDPHNPHVWEYSIEASKEAAKLGFREIQFDYVRFPTDGNVKAIKYSNENGEEMKDVIHNFLKYANEELAEYNVFLAADVFGLTTTTLDDMGMGQQYELIAEEVDYICPMVYPSHYGPYNYGFANPNAHPYGVVRQAMIDGMKKGDGKRAYIRPWLQDFNMGTPRYGDHEVREQIRAVYESDHSEWIMWNAANRYNESAYYNIDALKNNN